MTLDICICTHNPRPEILALVLQALARQTVAPGTFSLVLVDNASSPPIAEEVLAPIRQAGHAARLSHEPTLGIAAARLHAIRVTSGPWLLFVDDDNELAEDFVATGLDFIRSRDDLGCFGGRLLLPETLKPPRWVEPFYPFLGVKDAGSEVLIGAAHQWGRWEPPTAGCWICRAQLDAYLTLSESDGRTLDLGRKGKSGLASCEDALLARQSLALGLVNAYNPRLSLRHHLDPARFRTRYLFRLMVAYGRSHVLLDGLLKQCQDLHPKMPARYRRRWKFFWKLQRTLTKWTIKGHPRFALAMSAYHWTARRSYLLEERRVGAR